jgi:HPt (histidine-containing phosphotransfer) domain-containing protein
MGGRVTREMFDCVPEIDFDSGSRYFLGNIQNYAQALLSILKSIKSKLPILQSMMMTQEYEGLRSITQTLQKMFGNIGAGGLAEASYQLEKALLNDELTTNADLLTDYAGDLITFAEHLELLFKNVNFKYRTDREEDASGFMNYDFTKTKESIRKSSDLLERKII